MMIVVLIQEFSNYLYIRIWLVVNLVADFTCKENSLALTAIFRDFCVSIILHVEVACLLILTNVASHFRIVGKIEKSVNFVMSVCPSVCVAQLRSHSTDFHEIWVFFENLSRKSLKVPLNLTRITYFTRLPMHIYENISLNSF